MKYLSLLLFIALSWASYAKDAAENTADEPTTDGPAVKEAVKTPPARLSGHIDRSKAPLNDRETMTILTKELDKEHIQWLDTEYGPFVSVWYQDQSGNARGALLIVHAEGESAYWPGTTAPLHHSLPASGWSTLALTLPLPNKRATPKRTLPAKIRRSSTAETAKTEGGEPLETEDQVADKQTTSVKPVSEANLVKEVPGTKTTQVKPLGPDPEVVSLARLKAAINFLHDRGQYNIVIAGYGSGAIRANALLSSLTPQVKNPNVANAVEKPFRAFIVVNASNYLPDSTQKVEWFSDPAIPVLDVYINVHQRYRLAAKNRKVAAKRAKVETFQSVGLPEIVGQGIEENRLARRVRSFLKKHAEGVEVKNARLRRYR